MRLERRKIGGERKCTKKGMVEMGKKKIVFELCLSAETSPKIQGGTE